MVGLGVLVENDSIDMPNSEDFNNSFYTCTTTRDFLCNVAKKILFAPVIIKCNNIILYYNLIKTKKNYLKLD